MSAFNSHFDNAGSAFIAGKMSIEQVLVIAKEDSTQASYLLSMALTDLQPSTPSLRHEARCRIELQWAIDGANRCIHSSFAGLPCQNVIADFFAERLARHPEEFSDEHLRLVAHYWRSYPMIVSRVQELQVERARSYVCRRSQASRELTADVVQVKARVSQYNFTPELNDLLDKVENGLGSGDQFDQKALLAHLRTFFEKLHEQCALRLHQAQPETKDGTDLSKCQQVIDYLARKDVLTAKMQALGRALYGVLSEEGVHAIAAEREYVRLSRNMVAEYALVLFFELERRLRS